MDSGASGIYLTPEDPRKQVNWYATAILVLTASGQPQNSSDLRKLDLSGLPKDLPTSGYFMPGLHYNLMRISEFFDADCKVLFTKTSVKIFDKKGGPVITGWRENNGPK